MALTARTQPLADAVQALPQQEKQDLVRHLNSQTFPSGDRYKTQIWLLLLGGLFLIAISAVVAAVILDVKGKDGTAVVALASAVVAGVIGLFATPPTA